jgi:hypothetical protein
MDDVNSPKLSTVSTVAEPMPLFVCVPIPKVNVPSMRVAPDDDTPGRLMIVPLLSDPLNKATGFQTCFGRETDMGLQLLPEQA